MNGIFGSLFGGGNAAPAAAPAAPVAPTAPVAPAPAPAPVVTTVAAPAAQEDPLAGFTGMWDKLAAQQTEAAKNNTVSLGLDGKMLAEAASKLNFAPAVTPEFAASLGMSAEAAPQLQALLNQQAQTVFAQATLAASRLTEQALAKQAEQLNGRLPEMVKSAQFSDQLMQTMPQLNNPALQPMVEVIRAGIAANNPNLTPSQLATETQKFLSGFASVATAKPATATDASGGQKQEGPNILSYLGLSQ